MLYFNGKKQVQILSEKILRFSRYILFLKIYSRQDRQESFSRSEFYLK